MKRKEQKAFQRHSFFFSETYLLQGINNMTQEGLEQEGSSFACASII